MGAKMLLSRFGAFGLALFGLSGCGSDVHAVRVTPFPVTAAVQPGTAAPAPVPNEGYLVVNATSHLGTSNREMNEAVRAAANDWRYIMISAELDGTNQAGQSIRLERPLLTYDLEGRQMVQLTGVSLGDIGRINAGALPRVTIHTRLIPRSSAQVFANILNAVREMLGVARGDPALATAMTTTAGANIAMSLLDYGARQANEGSHRDWHTTSVLQMVAEPTRPGILVQGTTALVLSRADRDVPQLSLARCASLPAMLCNRAGPQAPRTDLTFVTLDTQLTDHRLVPTASGRPITWDSTLADMGDADWATVVSAVHTADLTVDQRMAEQAMVERIGLLRRAMALRQSASPWDASARAQLSELAWAAAHVSSPAHSSLWTSTYQVDADRIMDRVTGTVIASAEGETLWRPLFNAYRAILRWQVENPPDAESPAILRTLAAASDLPNVSGSAFASIASTRRAIDASMTPPTPPVAVATAVPPAPTVSPAVEAPPPTAPPPPASDAPATAPPGT